MQSRHPAPTTLALVESLYKSYFTEARPPATSETLLRACADAGVPGEEARRIVEDESVWAAETREALNEQVGNGVDAVPFVYVEGRRRDIGLEGCREVGEYVRVL